MKFIKLFEEIYDLSNNSNIGYTKNIAFNNVELEYFKATRTQVLQDYLKYKNSIDTFLFDREFFMIVIRGRNNSIEKIYIKKLEWKNKPFYEILIETKYKDEKGNLLVFGETQYYKNFHKKYLTDNFDELKNLLSTSLDWTLTRLN